MHVCVVDMWLTNGDRNCTHRSWPATLNLVVPSLWQRFACSLGSSASIEATSARIGMPLPSSSAFSCGSPGWAVAPVRIAAIALLSSLSPSLYRL